MVIRKLNSCKNMEEKIEKLPENGKQVEAIKRVEEEWKKKGDQEELLLRWGELLYAEGKMTEGLNKFNAVLRLNPENQKARNYVTMINNILGYFCKDLLNP